MGIFGKIASIDFSDCASIALRRETYVNSMKALGVPLWLAPTIATTSNWQDIVLLKAGLKKKADAHFRDGDLMERVTRESLPSYAIRRYAKFYNRHPIKLSGNGDSEFLYRGRKIRLEGKESVYAASDVFFSEAYAALACKGRVVMDIGANIGDTAIYFALRGAKHVYSYEPYPSAFRTAKRNIASNGFRRVVSLINCGLGGKTGSVRLSEKVQPFGGADLKESAKGKAVRIITLDQAARRIGKGVRAALKMDCEGCEYGILEACSDETLQKFDDIVLEYHYGHRSIAKRLRKAGFEIEKLGPAAFVFNEHASDRLMFAGTLHARNKNSQGREK